jgi:hypothetical protein
MSETKIETHQQDCPLCKSPATYIIKGYGSHKLFTCPICINFVIRDDAEIILTSKHPPSEEYLKSLSEKSAKEPQDKVAVIIKTEWAKVSETATTCELRLLDELISNWS